MHSIVWVLILAPPCLALILWQGFDIGSRTGNELPWQRVRMGKYGFWIVSTIFYAVMFAAAAFEHKL